MALPVTKRSIQTSNPGYYTGIEFDAHTIRAARVSADGRGSFTIATLEEASGDYSDEANLIESLRQLKTRLGVTQRDIVVTSLSGKQVFAAQLDFRRLSGEEMEQALRLELRKMVHFEVATSTLDYEILEDEEGSTSGQCRVMTALASNSLLSRQMAILEKAGLRPAAMEVLPLTVANALWAWRGAGGMESPCVAIHVGPQATTLIIDGEYSPFFYRSIPFAAEDANADAIPPSDRAKRLTSLADEVSRSLAFHEKNSGTAGYKELVVLGERLEDAEFAEAMRKRTGLGTIRMDLASKIGGMKNGSPTGKFDLAVALALRGDS
jgi:Tfp pilus assembly PilM family ATPase